MEDDIVEIYADPETHDLIMFIPASRQIFRLEIGDELVDFPSDATYICDVNFSILEKSCDICGKKYHWVELKVNEDGLAVCKKCRKRLEEQER